MNVIVQVILSEITFFDNQFTSYPSL